jgi:hypothetical protein
MALAHKEAEIQVRVAIYQDRDSQQEDEDGNLPAMLEQEIAGLFERLL